MGPSMDVSGPAVTGMGSTGHLTYAAPAVQGETLAEKGLLQYLPCSIEWPSEGPLL